MPNVRPIDANALIKMMVAENNRRPGVSWEITDIERYVTKLLPTINPDDLRPQGRWVQHNKGHNNWVECSECNTVGSPFWKCCPVCTAMMDSATDNNVGHKIHDNPELLEVSGDE